MIIYDLDSWEHLTTVDQLSEAELYFVYDGSEKRLIGMMEYYDECLNNESTTIFVGDSIKTENYWIMEFEWPAPPRQLAEKARDF
jgi:hypothetical protein